MASLEEKDILHKMKLRRLKTKDAPLMLEWMHDASVTEYLQKDFQNSTIEDCDEFIHSSWNDEKNLHLAIANDEDTYQGTVSLKNIDNGSAEFAITIRSSANGKAYAAYGMPELLNIAFSEKPLSVVYWYVAPENTRAIRFYDKNGYQKTDFEQIEKWNNRCLSSSAYIWYMEDPEHFNQFL